MTGSQEQKCKRSEDEPERDRQSRKKRICFWFTSEVEPSGYRQQCSMILFSYVVSSTALQIKSLFSDFLS